MHFSTHPFGCELVEVISGAHTSDETLDAVEELAEAFGKPRSASGKTRPASSSTASPSRR